MKVFLTLRFIGIFLLITLTSSEEGSFKYSVVGPKSLRRGTPYAFSVSTYGEKNLNFVLTASIKDSQNTSLVEKSYNLLTDETALLELEIPETYVSRPNQFYVSASGSVTFNENHEVNINEKAHSIFIQTDKVLYKPGQTVLYRIIVVNPDLKPYEKDINVTIYDTTKNTIVKLINQRSDYGVVTSNLSLSDITPLGTWTIIAQTKDEQAEKHFQVAEYVLPKFEVKVVAPSFYHVNTNNPGIQENLFLTVIAKYTHGQPVKGTASVEIKLSWMSNLLRLTKLIELKDGKADLSLTLAELNTLLPSVESWYSLLYNNLFVEANVTESITGIILSGNTIIHCEPNKYQLEFSSNSPNNYKPGLTYFGYLSMKKSDSTSPDRQDLVDGSGNFKSIVFTANQYNAKSSENFPSSLNFTVQLTAKGHISFGIDTRMFSGTIYMRATFYDDTRNDTIEAFMNIDKFATNGDENIQVTIENEATIIKPLTSVSFRVKTTKPISSYRYEIMAKGLLIQSQRIELTHSSENNSFVIFVSEELALKLAPEARVVVSCISESGEYLADSLAINVVDYFLNKVSLSFNKNQTKPGDDAVILNVKTRNNSYVGLLAVDQSVRLLGSGNDLTQDMINRELNAYGQQYYTWFSMAKRFKRSSPSDFMCPIWIEASDTYELLKKTGLFVLTNLHVHKSDVSEINTRLYSSFHDTDYYDGLDDMEDDMGNEMDEPRKKSDEMLRMDGVTATKLSVPANPVRQHFPETWIWTDITTEYSDGDYQLRMKVPDTITSWITTGFAINHQAGLGVSEIPAKITVTKPFFVSLNLPYSIIRGEEFALQVTLFNYLPHNLETTIRLLSSSYFKIRQCDDDVLLETDVVKNIEVESNDAISVYFWVVATSLGQIPFEVTAMAGLVADSVKETIIVKPEGQPQSYSTSALIQLASGHTYSSILNVSLPPSDVLVPGSVIIEVTAIGDILGSSLNGIEDLLQMPYGCGEQNLLNLVPDVYLLQYLTESGQLTSEFEIKATKFINEGYQRELTFQRRDGSFSAFGNSDAAGSIWLSSFVIKCFHQAKVYIPVEDSKIAETILFIIQHQNRNGTYSEPPEGRVLHTDMQGGSSAGLALTAYVLIALLENRDIKDTEQLQSSTANATEFLEREFSKYSTDPYALAIISYALYKASSPKLDDVLVLLDRLAINEAGLKYWKKEDEVITSHGWMCPYPQTKSYNIEIASYVLLVYSKKGDISRSLPIVKWLVKQRNAFGGFSSTQDTVLALEALASFSRLLTPTAGSTGIQLTVTGNGDFRPHAFDSITKENALHLQSTQLVESTTSIDVTASGEGIAVLQLIVRYNIQEERDNQFLSLSVSTTSSESNLTLTVSTSWNGTEVTGMVLIEINLLTGYVLADSKTIASQIGEKFKKIEKGLNKIVIYIDELTSERMNFNIRLEKLFSVTNVKPAVVKVYRYYEPTSAVSAFYSATSDQTWQGACPMCCA